MEKIYLVTTQTLKQNTAINNNVDDYLLTNAIWEAQTIYVQQATGSKLYNAVTDKVKNGTIYDASNSAYKLLLDDYIVPVIIYYAWYCAIPQIHYKTLNVGVNAQNSDNSTSTSLNEMQYLRNDVLDKAEFYNQRLLDFLKANKSDYHELTSTQAVDDIRPQSNNYFAGIVFGNDYPCKYNERVITL